MRRILQAGLVVAAALALAGPTAANETEARAIVERAIRAHGGAAALEKTLVCRRTDTGKLTVVNREVPFVSQVTCRLPDRIRLQIEIDRKVNILQILDGEKGWQSEGGAAAVPLLGPRVRELREEAYVWWLTRLVPLTRPGFKLATLERTKIDGESAVGIRVVRKGYADTRMYFLERNGLLARVERRTIEEGRTVDKEYHYSGYRDVGGVTLHTREIVKVNNRKDAEFTISNYSFPGKLGAGAFMKP